MRGSRRLRFLLVVLVLTAITLTALDVRAGRGSPFDALRRGGDTLLGPLQRAVGGAAGSAGGALGRLPDLGRYADDNRALQRRNDELTNQLRQTEDLRRRAAEWDALLRLKDFGTYTVVPAHVTSIGASFGFEWTATLDAGSRDGISDGQTVVTGKGLVGRTKGVGPYTCTVVLVVDKDFSVGSRLQRVASFGFASGDGKRDMSYELIGQNAQVRMGDVLLTSGSGTFVPGVPVGTVTGIRSSANALTRIAEVKPFVDTTALDLVGVVVEPPRGTPRLPIPPRPVPTGTARAGTKGTGKPAPGPPSASPSR